MNVPKRSMVVKGSQHLIGFLAQGALRSHTCLGDSWIHTMHQWSWFKTKHELSVMSTIFGFSALLLRINTSKGHPLCCKVASIRCLKDWNSGLVTLLLPEMQGTCSPTSMLFLVSCMEHTAPSISCRWAMCLYTTWQTMETTSNNNMCSTAWCASKALLLPLLLTACSQWSTPFSRPSSTAFHAWDNAFSGRVRFQYRCEENKVFCTDLGWVSSTLL